MDLGLAIPPETLISVPPSGPWHGVTSICNCNNNKHLHKFRAANQLKINVSAVVIYTELYLCYPKAGRVPLRLCESNLTNAEYVVETKVLIIGIITVCIFCVCFDELRRYLEWFHESRQRSQCVP